MKRHEKRGADQLRPLAITYNVFEYAPGSVLFEFGKTRVLCAVTLQSSVPLFLRGRGVGWLTAEYALLPASTISRTNREASMMRRNGRSIEISRLISRSLRTVIDTRVLGERTLMVDCDVLQADGGTRVASITGAYAALMMAQQRLLADGVLEKPFLKDGIAAVSVAVLKDGSLALDPDYLEDSSCVADINFIMTYSGKLIEVQGGAEKEPVEWDVLREASDLACAGAKQIVSFFDSHKPLDHDASKFDTNKDTRASLFSLQKRFQQVST